MIQIVWEFHIQPGKREEFERHYSATGTWAEFFQRDTAFKGTQLLRDMADPTRYFTIDCWEDEDSYGAFRAVHRQEYTALDQRMQALTESEKRIGVFEVAVNGAARAISGN